MKAKYLLPAVATVLLISGVAMAQDDEVNWNSLTEAQQQVLGPVAENWDSLPIERRARLVEGAKRWSEMDVEEGSGSRPGKGLTTMSAMRSAIVTTSSSV